MAIPTPATVENVGNLYWIFFNIGVLLLLWADLKILHNSAEEIPIGKAIKLSVFWIGLALLFNIYIAYSIGYTQAVEFLTAYLVEKSLSVDNLFVFLLIFSHFQVDRKYQHRILFYGILGALIMRAVFIYVGVSLLTYFEELIYILGAFLVFSGTKLVRTQLFSRKDEEEEEAKPRLIEFFGKIGKNIKDVPGQELNFFYTPKEEDNKKGLFFLKPTRLFIVLLCIELCDVIFALDSIPAVLAISKDPFIIYSSNVCAILGLRALFFALSGIMSMFRYLDHGLAIILIFVGAKMMMKSVVEIPPVVSLVCIIAIMIGAVVLSLVLKEQEKNDDSLPPQESKDEEQRVTSSNTVI